MAGDMDGKNILVTGGTGSFGNAFTSHVLSKYKPNRVVIFSRDEFKQYQMEQKFGGHPALRFFIGDVRDMDRLNFAMNDIDVVFHAAAMKQVVASEYNPIECIKTNVLGAENIIRVAIQKKIPKVVAVSTDKAVKPINLYGSSKACMEKLFVAANHLAGKDGTRFACVRYGNVIGSRGSVIPVFLAQKDSGVLSITDERMTRFWLRIEDGVAFVDDCARMMKGGETFVKKVPSMRITDLARAIAPDCKLNIIGIRPGEKLHEAMVAEEESLVTKEYKDFYVVEPQIKMWGDGKDAGVYNGEKGKAVSQGFSYTSENNTVWLGVDDILTLIDQTNIVSH
jgi:UDP-N-acetylglucosamine 4,6-dehydratase/5-epimerase